MQMQEYGSTMGSQYYESMSSVMTESGDEQHDNSINPSPDGNNTTSSKSKKKSKTKTKKPKQKKKKNVLEGTEMKKYLCAPMLLLYLKGGEKLLPLAIQLTPEPSDHARPLIFTKNDDNGEYSDWLLGKMWVRVAEANVHHFVGHALMTHLLMEPVALSVARNLPSVHPISKLLIPYLRSVVTVNTIYRKSVLPADGALAEVLAIGERGLELMKQAFGTVKQFTAMCLPEDLAQRGVMEEDVLPGYYYRDDGLKLWEAIQDFVTEVLCIYYDDDDQVDRDDELAGMLADLGANGFLGFVKVPERLNNLQDVVTICTTIIFNVSVQHCALSRGMIDIYAYCLNAPPFMTKPPPTNKRGSGYTEEEMKELLPPPVFMERYIGAAILLAGGFHDPAVSQ